MQIIKDQQIIDNVWTYADDQQDIADQDNITVSLTRWLDNQQLLLSRSGKTGVRLTPSDDSQALAGHLAGLELIELDFPGFGDGRLFSIARLLRSRLAYQGELRAVGNFLADQVFYLHRVGVNAFQLNNPQQIPLALQCFNDFTVTYQA